MTRVWPIIELIRWTTEYLANRGIREPRLNAELLLASVLGLKRLDLYLQFDRPLREEELADFKGRLLRRARHEPLQYIAGDVEFRELRLRVDRRALIPRPETEVLVGEVLSRAAGREGLDAVDIGTGSGAIALSLAREGRFARIVATDVSADALALARENSAQIGEPLRVDFRLGPGYLPIARDRFDIIVSNPPYVGLSERETLDVEVRDWEPEVALFSGQDGLGLIRELVLGAPAHLRAGGLLALEVGAGQGQAVAELVRASGVFSEPDVRLDLAGRDRIVLALYAGQPHQEE